MKIQKNVPLSNYTTFHIGGPAKFFCEVKTEKQLLEAAHFAKEKKEKIFILGGGSNVLIADAGFWGLVIKMELMGIKIKKSGKTDVIISAQAGELWDEVVELAVKKGYYGIENLSAIPGTVGATPVQNIGAYGAEVSNSIESVRALDLMTLEFVEFTRDECNFRYRESLFKDEKDRYVITEVRYHLTKNGHVDVSYRDLQNYFKDHRAVPTLSEVRDAVIAIRWKKLPNWKLWGTAGSFFKNPVISEGHYTELKKKYPELPGFPEAHGLVKVPLGWILDKICNMRGYCQGNVCTHYDQALVIVTKPGATAEDVVDLATGIMSEVKKATNIEVEGEVQWVN